MPADRSAPRIFLRAAPSGTGGEALRVDLAARLLSMQYDDEERRADKLTLALDNYDLALYDDPAFRKGMELEVAWGYAGNMTPVRTVVVTSIKGALTVNVEANARSLLLNTVTRNRRFEHMRRSDIVRQIANEAGYTQEDVLDIEETPNVLESVQQARLTDAQFVRRLANLEGFQFFVDQTGFHFHRRRVGQAPTKTLVWFVDRSGTITDFNIDNDITARPTPGRTRLRGRDSLARADIDVHGDDAQDAGRPTLSTVREVIDPESGRARIEASVGAEETLPTSAGDAATAQREATGRFRRQEQTAVRLSLDCIGDPGLLAKTVVEVQGLGRRLSQRYYVKKASTKIDGGGYMVKLTTISDGSGGHSTESRLAQGLSLLDPGPPTSGRPNTAPASDGAEPTEGAPLEPREEIDPEGGGSRIRYVDSRGRAQTGDEG